MLSQIILEAWIALKRNVTRSLLTMLGIVWGIATVTLLIVSAAAMATRGKNLRFLVMRRVFRGSGTAWSTRR